MPATHGQDKAPTSSAANSGTAGSDAAGHEVSRDAYEGLLCPAADVLATAR
jgi:hypothetical protein